MGPIPPFRPRDRGLIRASYDVSIISRWWLQEKGESLAADKEIHVNRTDYHESNGVGKRSREPFNTGD